MSIDDDIDALGDELERVGVARPRPPGDLGALEKIDRTVQPLGLPIEVRRVWERIDPSTLRVNAWMELNDPGFALEMWHMHRDSPPVVPDVLFPVCSASWNYYLVELQSAGHEGGALFEWGYAGADFVPRLRGIADWIGVTTVALREGAFTRYGDQITLDSERFEELVTQRFAQTGPHPDYASVEVIPDGNRRRWPAHWRKAKSKGEPPPKLPKLTVRDVLAARPDTPVHATVRCFAGAVAASGHGSRLLLRDESGWMDAWCPSTLPKYTAIGLGNFCNLDIVAPPGPDIIAAAARGHGIEAPRYGASTSVSSRAWNDTVLQAPPLAAVEAIRILRRK